MTPISKNEKRRRALDIIEKTMKHGGDDVVAVHDAYEWLCPEDRKEILGAIHARMLMLHLGATTVAQLMEEAE